MIYEYFYQIFLRIPLKYCEEILNAFQQNKTLIPYDFKDEEYTQKYNRLLNLIDNLANSNSKISEQIILIYNQLFDISQNDKLELKKFNFFLKQITDFENIFGEKFNSRKSDIIIQIENSIISENPYSVLEIEKNDLIISTPQKIIDNKLKTKYQIWLDISSSEWIKSDTGPLYNAWVFQKDWDKPEYTIEDNIELSKEKKCQSFKKTDTMCRRESILLFKFI